MGTVEKIVDHMNRMCLDKKAQATERFMEHSAWVTSEFDKIRDLLQYNCPQKEFKSGDTSENRQKRKSPETCCNGSRNSPMSKRVSADYIELAVADGLPADLNRLKKEELLQALEERGICTMTMKALKKDLIEALKDVLLDIHLRKNTTSAMNSSEYTKPVIEEEHQCESSLQYESAPERKPSISDPPARKQSILAEARHHVSEARASILQENVESEEDRSQRLAKEYEARRMRHRSSQIRLSQVVTRLDDTGDSQNKEDEEREEDEQVVSSTPFFESQEDLQQNDDTVDEISSPHKSDLIDLSDEALSKTPHDGDSETLPAPTSVSKMVAALEMRTQSNLKESLHTTSPRSEKAKTLPAPIKAVCATKEAEASRPTSVKIINSSDSISSHESVVSGNKGTKPTNIVGGTQTSFLSSNSGSSHNAATKPKPVVPALQKAALLKEKEEARALQKKKELEEKKKEHMRKMQNTSSTNTSSSKFFQSSKTSGKPASSVVSQKKGFGWFGSKKDTVIKEPTASSTSVAKNDVVAKETPSIPAPPPVATSHEEPRAEVVEQENLKPSAMAAAAPPAAASSSTEVLQEKKIIAAEYTATTPAKVGYGSDTNSYEASPSPPREEYKIDDRDDSSSDDGSGTDDDDDDKQQIPEWARGPKLREALEKQYGINGHTAVDPDLIFPDIQTCNLEEIFGRREGKCGKYSVRTSSAKWDADKITLVEKRKYRSQMGFTVNVL